MALIAFKVGCQVKNSVRHLKAALTIKQLPKLVAFAAATRLPYQVPRIRFDTDSFVIGADTFASITLGNHPDQLEDLKMHNDTEVEEIKGDLDIKGSGTFKFHIKDDEEGVHLIKIPNSKYVPDLRVCLLSPHHWVQKAKDHHPVPKGTKTNTNNEALTLMWNQRRHQWTIQYHPLTNTPSFRTAPASCIYRAFVALFKAAEAQYHRREPSSKCPANSTSTKNSLPKRTSTPASSRNHLWPLREPRATTSRYKQATFCQKRGRQGGEADNKDGATHLQRQSQAQGRRACLPSRCRQPGQTHALALLPWPPGLLQAQATCPQW
jgi:hypothetical protein